jgi:uncharacterized protein YndB with AHSA1/START domain
MQTDSIKKTVLLRASLKRVWRALSDSKEFGTWFGVRFDGPFVPGASLRGASVPTLVDPDVAKTQKEYEGLMWTIRVEKMEEEKLLSFRWVPYVVEDGDYSHEPTTLVEFELEKTDDGVLLTVKESGFDNIPLERRAKAFSENAKGWDLQTKLIEKYVTRTSE